MIVSLTCHRIVGFCERFENRRGEVLDGRRLKSVANRFAVLFVKNGWKNAIDECARIQPFMERALETTVIEIITVDVDPRSERVCSSLPCCIGVGILWPIYAKTALRRLLRPVAFPFLSDWQAGRLSAFDHKADASVN